MLAKLAFRNVRRSVRDYAVYFITLVLGVAVFYAFDSISAQRILFDIETAGTDMWGMIDYIMTMFSVVVAVVLGFLVVYANSFLLKRRKQEFGTYLLLGMRPGQVSAIVLMETLSVGLGSLLMGALLGVVLSQGLSFLTAGMFGLVMKDYQFVFSGGAMVKTILVFLVIFAIVALLNIIQIRRCRLITLLSARHSSEKFKVRPLGLSIVAFVVSLVCIGCAYWQLDISGLVAPGREFTVATVLMLIGTALFFWSVSGFVLAVLQKTRGLYLKGMTMFTMRQLASRINAACATLWAVCVMLFFSITAFSTGVGLATIFTSGIEEATLYDASIKNYCTYDQGNTVSVEQWNPMVDDMVGNYLCNINGWNEYVSRASQINIWNGDITYGQLVDAIGFDVAHSSLANSSTALGGGVSIVGISQVNASRELSGRSTIQLKEGEYAVLNTATVTQELSESAAKYTGDITLFGTTLRSSGEVVKQELCVTALLTTSCFLVVPDSVVDLARANNRCPNTINVNVAYKAGVNRAAADEALVALEDLSWLFPNAKLETLYTKDAAGTTHPQFTNEDGSLTQDQYPAFNATAFQVYTADQMRNQSVGLSLLLDYLAIYIGFVLLVSTAAILAIQQLCATNDSVGRYRTLAQLGATKSQLFGSLRVQTLVYFLAPLALAVCHWACTYLVMKKSVFEPFGLVDSTPVIFACVVTVIVYGAYMVVTYFGSRNIVVTSVGRKMLN